MPSSEKAGAITGRQYKAVAKIPLEFADFATSGDHLVTGLPEGAVVTEGFIRTNSAFDATATMTVTVEDPASVLLDTLSGALAVSAVGLDSLVPTGVELASAGQVNVNTNIVLTQGSGYLYLDYIVDGRTHFTEG